jgi:phage N-6-adenine-methyltransferase
LEAAPAAGRPPVYCSRACRQHAYRRRSVLSVHFSSKKHDYSTPQEFFDELDAEFGGFTVDVCATANNAKCAKFFTKEDDGLAQTWTGRVFMNPPYGRQIGRWMTKAFEAAQTTAELVVALVPARVDTAWWHDTAAQGEVRFLRGRLCFGNASSSAPFPSAVVIFRNEKNVTKFPKTE